jgi:hypothetical protein
MGFKYDPQTAAWVLARVFQAEVTPADLPELFWKIDEANRQRLIEDEQRLAERVKHRPKLNDPDDPIPIPPNQKRSRIRLQNGRVLDFDANWRSREEQLRKAFARITRREFDLDRV